MVNTTLMITAIIGIVIGIIILTALGSTITDQTYTGVCANDVRANTTGCELENSSSTGKTMYSLIELLYPIMGVLFIVGIGFAIRERI